MSKKLIPIPMVTFWGLVASKINKVLGTKHANLPYIADVCRGRKINREIDEVKRGCMRAVIDELRHKGMAPKIDVTPYL